MRSANWLAKACIRIIDTWAHRIYRYCNALVIKALMVSWRIPYALAIMNRIAAKQRPYVGQLPPAQVEGIRRALRRKRVGKIQLSGTAVLVGFAREAVVYAPFGTGAATRLAHAYRTYRFLQQSALRRLVAYDLQRYAEKGFTLYCAERLAPVPSAEVERVAETLLQVLACGHVTAQEDNGQLLTQARTAINAVLPQDIRAHWLSQLEALDRAFPHRCPMHGDFTPMNLMMGREGPVLIDLDRFHFHGFSFFDRLHLQVERYVKTVLCDWLHLLENEKPWWSLAPTALREAVAVGSDVGDFYFLVRLTLEYRQNEMMPRSWAVRVVDCAKWRKLGTGSFNATHFRPMPGM